MESEIVKRAYYLPAPLMDFFAEWSKPGRDFSTSVAGSVLIWMTLPADLREKAKQEAYKPNVKQSLAEMQFDIAQSLITVAMARHFELSPKERDEYIRYELQALKVLYPEQFKDSQSKKKKTKSKKGR